MYTFVQSETLLYPEIQLIYANMRRVKILFLNISGMLRKIDFKYNIASISLFIVLMEFFTNPNFMWNGGNSKFSTSVNDEFFLL